MVTRGAGALSVLAGLAVLGACGDARPVSGATGSGLGCATCHGGLDDDSGAPPYDLSGNVAGDAVGAHRKHLSSGVPCRSCHVVPTDLEHAVGPRPADVVFGGLATARGTPEPYDHASGTCSGVYCHGATLAGGLDREPRWNAALAGAPCGSCHGFPPLGVGPHTAGMTACGGCHEGTHLDGNLDVATGCTSCHGGVDNSTGAPPGVAIGNTVGDAVVGAHTVHVNVGVACSACHGATAPGAPGHADGGRAEVQFTGTAVADLATPSYDAASFTCSGVYCHGGTLAGGTQPSPAWTGSLAGCTPCHGLPPVPPHSAGDTACTSCHPAPIAPTHVNGAVDVESPHADGFASPAVHGPQYLDRLAGASGALDCRSCHGDALSFCDACHSSAASGSWQSWETNCTFCHGTRTPAYTAAKLVDASPPDAVSQRLTGTAAPTRTGKHRSHLAGTPDYPPIACGACHAVPSAASHVGPELRATVAFSAADAFPGLTAEQLAALPNPIAVYDASTGRCAGYCHGSTMQGGTLPNPRWSSASSSVNCNSCHGQPPETGRTMAADFLYCDQDCSLHVWHLNLVSAEGFGSCGACHGGSAHVSGVADVGWPSGVTGTWDAFDKSCAVSCHASNPRSWTAP